MINKTYVRYFSLIPMLLLQLSFYSCEVNEESQFPLIQTGEVTDIDSTGATFHAKIVNRGETDITGYGFVWRRITHDRLELDIQSSNVYLHGFPEEGTILERVDFDLSPDVDHYVCAFIQSYETVIYGRQVNFFSKGSAKPIIFEHYDRMGTTGIETVIIGDNFSNSITGNRVHFEVLGRRSARYATILEASKERIIVKNPYYCKPNLEFKVAVTTANCTVYAEELYYCSNTGYK